MKTGRRKLAANDTNFRGKMSVYRGHPSRGRHFVKRYVHMRHLSQGMDSGVGSPRPVQFYRCRDDLKKSALQMILNRILVGLTLPSAKWSTVVGDGQLQAFESRAHCKESK